MTRSFPGDVIDLGGTLSDIYDWASNPSPENVGGIINGGIGGAIAAGILAAALAGSTAPVWLTGMAISAGGIIIGAAIGQAFPESNRALGEAIYGGLGDLAPNKTIWNQLPELTAILFDIKSD